MTNPGFENGTTGWAPLSGTTFGVTSNLVHTGTSAAILTRKSSSGTGIAGLTDAPNQFTQVPVGSSCTASAWVSGPTGAKAVLKWTALNGTTKVTTKSTSVSFTGGWQQLPVATLTMPSGASTADLQFSAPSFPAGSSWYLDDVTASCAGGSTPPPPSSSGYAARWLLNEVLSDSTSADDVSGQAKDSVNGNTGTAWNINGNGSVYSFNGYNSRVIVPDSPTLDPSTADFSFGVRLQMTKAPAEGETYDVLRKGITTTQGGDYKLEIAYSNGNALGRCVVKDAQKVVGAIRASKDLVGAAHTVECSRVGNSVKIYIDGALSGTKTVAGLGSVSNDASLAIGAKAEGTAPTGFDWYLGTIDEAWVRFP